LRHNLAAHRHVAAQSTYRDHTGPTGCFTTRAPQLDLNFARSSVVWA
jgi:hypothetical protein